MFRFSEVLAIVALTSQVALCAAQEPAGAPAQAEQPMTTLRVFMDLIQVPVLVLDEGHQPLRPIDPSRFSVSLDGGPPFRPKTARQEGDDPITLAILLDPSSDSEILPQIPKALGALASKQLRPSDHVSLYTMDCDLIRSMEDVAADSAGLEAVSTEALNQWNQHRKSKAPCEKRVGLWDSIGAAVKEIGALPGRRVLLAVTAGEDHGSKLNPFDLVQFAQTKGVAVFGYSPGTSAAQHGSSFAPTTARDAREQPSSSGTPRINHEDPFLTLVGSSGGVIVSYYVNAAPGALKLFLRMVRERYILEFSRPRNESPGNHSIEVTVAGLPRTTYVRTAGVRILGPNAAAAKDPNTLQRDSSDAPELGPRKPIKRP